MSKKAIWPLFSSSIVKEILGSQALRVLWKEETASFLIITKLSSTYRFQTLGGTDEVLIAKSSITSTQRLATMGLTGLPIAQPWIRLYMQLL